MTAIESTSGDPLKDEAVPQVYTYPTEEEDDEQDEQTVDALLTMAKTKAKIEEDQGWLNVMAAALTPTNPTSDPLKDTCDEATEEDEQDEETVDALLTMATTKAATENDEGWLNVMAETALYYAAPLMNALGVSMTESSQNSSSQAVTTAASFD